MRRRAARRIAPPHTRAARFLRLVWHVLKGCAISACVFPLVSRDAQLRIIRRWSRGVLEILKVRLQVHGAPPSGVAPTLVVSNHVSWLDIWLIHSVDPVRFVAKADIRRWPLVGWLVGRAGTIFIERDRRHDTARTNRVIIDTLARGERVGIFPEGTTTDGSELKPFHASLFQPAVGAAARIVAVALRYPGVGDGPNLDAAYTGERSLLESLRLILRHRTLRAELIFAGVVDVSGKTRREIARETETLIAGALRLPVPGRKPGRSDGPPVGRQ